MVRCCNAALGAPGPIPSGPFPHQNPKSRDADSAGFVRGSLQQDHAAAETTNQQILICRESQSSVCFLPPNILEIQNHTIIRQQNKMARVFTILKKLKFSILSSFIINHSKFLTKTKTKNIDYFFTSEWIFTTSRLEQW